MMCFLNAVINSQEKFSYDKILKIKVDIGYLDKRKEDD